MQQRVLLLMQMWKDTGKAPKEAQAPRRPSHLWDVCLSSHEAAMIVNQLNILRTAGGRE